MARKQKAQIPANHDRWLVSYADFITLLFAFFVVMFASTQTDHNRAQQISDSVKKALSDDRLRAALAAVLGGTVTDKGKGNAMMRGPGGSAQAFKEHEPVSAPRIVELLQSYQLLNADLKAELETGKMQIHMEHRGLVISFTQAATFASGGDEITSGAIESIGKVAVTLNKIPNPIRLEGHTDSIPINTGRFRSNWELSAARSIAMLDILANRFHIPKRRMSIGGYGDAAPIDTNETEAGRARNRRVDMVILNETGMAAEPSAAPEPAPKAAQPLETNKLPRASGELAHPEVAPSKKPSPTDSR